MAERTSPGDETALLPSDGPVQLIDQTGAAVDHGGYKQAYARPGDAVLLAGYEQLVLGRRINDQAGALVRQGRMAVYPSSHGQEACQVAAAMVLDANDWLFPTYRDTVAVLARGVDPVAAFEMLRGSWHSGYNPLQWKVATQATPLATQLLHAVGMAHAAKLKGEDTVVLALCGDGATSEGDFHEALNFAAVSRVPVVFLVQNNEFAISVPLSQQTAAPSLAHKGIGYGLPGERVDGNDLAALLAVLGAAVDRARAGGGPSLVEAHTYRMQSHTNADDATRYRSDAEVARWVPRDPLARMRTYLSTAGVLDAAGEERIAAHADAVAARLRDGLNTEVSVDPQELFAHVYAEPTPQLREQSAFLAAELERAGAVEPEGAR
ncbi:thiamine pyrophosphate-dependent enzyme [Pseudarthrobacter sp. P1]|uniref:thiamine pyrophosphate-dependent enzyme n=1 Tax=Pseudarthrobacter sp. P1 TaxID=3418418 RepID=UPI003CF70205